MAKKSEEATRLSDIDPSLRFEQMERVDEILEGFLKNPSNRNKYRTQLYAYITEFALEVLTAAEENLRYLDYCPKCIKMTYHFNHSCLECGSGSPKTKLEKGE